MAASPNLDGGHETHALCPGPAKTGDFIGDFHWWCIQCDTLHCKVRRIGVTPTPFP